MKVEINSVDKPHKKLRKKGCILIPTGSYKPDIHLFSGVSGQKSGRVQIMRGEGMDIEFYALEDIATYFL